jgi:hypothetical protein
MEDSEFQKLFNTLPSNRQAILQWELEHYRGTSLERAQRNIEKAIMIIGTPVNTR